MISLDRLVNVLGGYGARLRWCPVERSVALRSVALPKALEGRAVAGDVLLAIGADSVDQALEWAAAAHAVITVVRGDGDQEPITHPTVAVLLIDPTMSWGELAAAVYGLVLEGRETASGRGPTDLFALADSLAEQIGHAVLIEDQRCEVLAYSRRSQDTDTARTATILTRRPPDQLIAFLSGTGVFEHLTNSDETLFIPESADHGLIGRMVVAARAGRELLGSVWVVCPAPLTGSALTALVDGAHTVALHLLRSRASADLERQVESDLVTRLLDGAPDAASLASRLGLPPTALRVVAVRARSGPDRNAALLMAFERVTTGFGWSRPGRSALAETTVYTVLPADRAATARTWLDALIAMLPDGLTVVAGISGSATAAELRSARREADECLALHEAIPAGRPAPAYDESWGDIVLRRLRAAAHFGRAPQRGPIAELRMHDYGHGTPYVATLRALLRSQGDPAAAGVLLGVHENTVRYRLRKMAEITDLPLDDPDKRLAMTIELASEDAC